MLEVTDGVGYGYRGNLFYSLAKISAIHLAEARAGDFRHRSSDITSLAITPGFLRSEAMLDLVGVTEENWRDAINQDPHFSESETPYYVARAVTALAMDPNVADKAGRTLTSWDPAREYDFTDVDGRQPHWAEYMANHVSLSDAQRKDAEDTGERRP